jgi:hypothetical protein
VPRRDNAPQAHSRVSNINFDIWIWGGDPFHIPLKITEGRQSSSVKDPGNTFNLSSKWARALPSLLYFYGILIEIPFHNIFSNIIIDI